MVVPPPLFSRHWLPTTKPKALVIIVHGLGDHSGRFDHVARYLRERGYAVYALDYSGHGQSPGKRVFVDSLNHLSQDLSRYVTQVRSQHPDLKMFIYAHSMGTLPALRFSLIQQDRLAGLMLSGTPLNLGSLPSILVGILEFLNRAMPTMPLFPNLGTGILSKDRAVVKAYNEDPLVYHGWLPVRILHYLVVESRRLRTEIPALHRPLLILHGADDRLCAPPGSQLLYDHATSADKTLKLYPGLRHEIHNEIEQNEVLSDVASWLDQHGLPPLDK